MNKTHRRSSGERGAVLAIVGVSMMALLALFFTFLSIGDGLNQRRRGQHDSDAAAAAAAYWMISHPIPSSAPSFSSGLLSKYVIPGSPTFLITDSSATVSLDAVGTVPALGFLGSPWYNITTRSKAAANAMKLPLQPTFPRIILVMDYSSSMRQHITIVNGQGSGEQAFTLVEQAMTGIFNISGAAPNFANWGAVLFNQTVQQTVKLADEMTTPINIGTVQNQENSLTTLFDTTAPSGDWTNIAGGIQAGVALLARNEGGYYPGNLILVSDGDPDSDGVTTGDKGAAQSAAIGQVGLAASNNIPTLPLQIVRGGTEVANGGDGSDPNGFMQAVATAGSVSGAPQAVHKAANQADLVGFFQAVAQSARAECEAVPAFYLPPNLPDYVPIYAYQVQGTTELPIVRQKTADTFEADTTSLKFFYDKPTGNLFFNNAACKSDVKTGAPNAYIRIRWGTPCLACPSGAIACSDPVRPLGRFCQ